MKKKLSKVTTPVSAKMEKKEPLRSILKKEVCMPPPVNAWKARDEVRRLPCALFLREFVCVWSGPCARVLRSASAARAASAACRCRSRVAYRKTCFCGGQCCKAGPCFPPSERLATASATSVASAVRAPERVGR